MQKLVQKFRRGWLKATLAASNEPSVGFDYYSNEHAIRGSNVLAYFFPSRSRYRCQLFAAVNQTSNSQVFCLIKADVPDAFRYEKIQQTAQKDWLECQLDANNTNADHDSAIKQALDRIRSRYPDKHAFLYLRYDLGMMQLTAKGNGTWGIYVLGNKSLQFNDLCSNTQQDLAESDFLISHQFEAGSVVLMTSEPVDLGDVNIMKVLSNRHLLPTQGIPELLSVKAQQTGVFLSAAIFLLETIK